MQGGFFIVRLEQWPYVKQHRRNVCELAENKKFLKTVGVSYRGTGVPTRLPQPFLAPGTAACFLWTGTLPLCPRWAPSRLCSCTNVFLSRTSSTKHVVGPGLCPLFSQKFKLKWEPALPNHHIQMKYRLTECFGLGGTFTDHLLQPLCRGQAHLPLDQVAKRPVSWGGECFVALCGN